MKKAVLVLCVGICGGHHAHAVLEVQLVGLQHEVCTYANGSITVTGVGGVPPYSYTWADGPTTPDRGGLAAGTYTVTVTDANSDEASLAVDVLSNPYALTAIGYGVAWCGAPGNILEDPGVSGTTNNWMVNGMPTVQQGQGQMGELWYTFYPDPWETNFAYTVDDGNGCTGTISGQNGPQVINWPELTITGVEPSCSNAPLGAIHVQSAGLAPEGLTWVALIRDDQVMQPQAYQPDQGTLQVDFANLEPGYYGIHWWLGFTAEALDSGECSYDTLWVTVPDLGPVCGSVQGISYIDLDGDCVQDANEAGVPYSPLIVQPGNEAVLTNAFGQFAFGLQNGDYTLEQTDPTLLPICPGTQPVPFTVSGNASTIDLANSSTEPLDLRASLAGGVFRPGFNAYYHVLARNDSPQQSGPVTVILQLDPALTYVTSDFAPTVNGNTLTWTLAPFTTYQDEGWYVTVNVPVGTPLGTPLNSTLTVSNTLPDANAANDSETANDVVVGSYDPNDKRAQTSSRASGSLYYINSDEWIDYTIRFQNTGTYPAEFVVITDTIAAELDMLSFEQGVASHPFTVSFKPGRVIEWRFDNIQLPDSTTDEPGSHGLVRFRMKPVQPLVAGTVITNVANIYFDYNEPVITEPSVLVAEFSTGVGEKRGGSITLSPVPASDRLTITGTYTIERLTVLSADGRVVLRANFRSMNGTLDLQRLSRGAYLLIAEMNDGTTARERFVKH